MAISGIYVPITAEAHILEKNGNHFQAVLKATLPEVKVMNITTINKRFQITIPKEIREQLQLCAGDKLEIQPGTEKYFIIKPLESVVYAIFGLWREEKESLQYINEIRDETESRFREITVEAPY